MVKNSSLDEVVIIVGKGLIVILKDPPSHKRVHDFINKYILQS